jgi:hypothetical protein
MTAPVAAFDNCLIGQVTLLRRLQTVDKAAVLRSLRAAWRISPS